MACIASGEGERKCTLGGDRCGSVAGLAADEELDGLDRRPDSVLIPCFLVQGDDPGRPAVESTIPLPGVAPEAEVVSSHSPGGYRADTEH
jgi:hypothetical protein